ncbi:hypothetical protein P8C59_007638 [Phyllachora maydis]|uniref:Uncharacterized protein n=1 Tax=Phyllachora maydis TaxID=1825666 RepID=A0AAD9MDR7_9PEZI|nr:hypothetical protein P8C59_007638 [Phyllachora maydis]
MCDKYYRPVDYDKSLYAKLERNTTYSGVGSNTYTATWCSWAQNQKASFLGSDVYRFCGDLNADNSCCVGHTRFGGKIISDGCAEVSPTRRGRTRRAEARRRAGRFQIW